MEAIVKKFDRKKTGKDGVVKEYPYLKFSPDMLAYCGKKISIKPEQGWGSLCARERMYVCENGWRWHESWLIFKRKKAHKL